MTEDDEEYAELEAFFNGPEFQAEVVDRGSHPTSGHSELSRTRTDWLAGEFDPASSLGRFLAGTGDVVPLPGEDSMEVDPHDSAALAIQARTYLSLAFKKGETALVIHRNQREEFDTSVQQMAFDLIHARVRRLLTKQDKPSFWEDVAWLFGRDDEASLVQTEKTGVTFALACDVLNARVEVFRLRIMYEFWLRWTVFPVPVPAMAENLPQTLLAEVQAVAQGVGRRCVIQSWMHPGIGTAQLVAAVLDSYEGVGALVERSTIEMAIADLEREYFLSQNEGHWYCTGRNPAVKDALRREAKGWGYSLRGGSFSWSRLFGW